MATPKNPVFFEYKGIPIYHTSRHPGDRGRYKYWFSFDAFGTAGEDSASFDVREVAFALGTHSGKSFLPCETADEMMFVIKAGIDLGLIGGD